MFSLKPHVHKRSNQVSKWPEGQFLPYGYCSIDRAPLLYSSWENLSLFRHLSNSSEPTRTGVREGESRRKGTSVIDNVALALVHYFVCIWWNILTNEGFPFDYRWWHHVRVTAPTVKTFGLRWKLLRDSHRGLKVQLTLKHPFNGKRKHIFDSHYISLFLKKDCRLHLVVSNASPVTGFCQCIHYRFLCSQNAEFIGSKIQKKNNKKTKQKYCEI